MPQQLVVDVCVKGAAMMGGESSDHSFVTTRYSFLCINSIFP
jgi:hypothetical protein